MRQLSVSVFSSVLLLAACNAPTAETSAADDAASETDATEVPMSQTASTDCAISDSRDWSAWINKSPGVDAVKTLHIKGEVVVPTPGYSFEWTEGPADRAMPPGLRFNLSAIPPSGSAAMVITDEQVAYEAETPYDAIRQISISCGGIELATITDIEIVE